ncbi:putative sulfate exporter family transporter, partial [Cohnella xylanilytica]
RRAGLSRLPWYLLGFLAASLLASTRPDAWLPLPAGWEDAAARLTTALLTAAMAGLGLSVDLRELRGALRPLAVLLIVSALLSALTYLSLAL